MRKSIAAEYFSLCIALIAASLICMAAVLISFSISTYKDDQKELLGNICSDVRISTLSYLSSSGDLADVRELYLSKSARSDAEFILFGSSGDVLVSSEASPSSHSDNGISAKVLKTGTADGFFSISSLEGFFDEAQLCLLYKLDSGSGSYYLLAYLPAYGMMEYLRNMVIVFAALFLLIMVVVYPLLKYTINRILRPVKEMTLAAKRFGEGDFSEKVRITDQNEMGFLANTLNEMASSLEAIEENRKSFISNVSHELRTPMTTIGGFVDGILDGTIPESQHKQYLKTVSEEINRLARLVRSMLNISKYEAGELQLQTEDFDVTELTVKTVLLFEKRIEGKNIDIRGLDSDRHFVNADMDLIQQVIYNLTENAVKFVDFGGYIAYDFRSEGDQVIITIRNSGEGLKKNEINKVFDRFYKTDESRGKDKTGVGLGLSIVRSIIKLHEGSILVRSKQGEYTEFEFSIPAGNPPARRSEQ